MTRRGLTVDEVLELWARIDTSRRLSAGQRFNLDHALRGVVRRQSSMLQYYATTACIDSSPRATEGVQTIRLPRKFSFIEDPDAALAALESLIAHSIQGTRSLRIDQSAVATYDFCAGLMLSIVAREATRRLAVGFAGIEPTDIAAREISIATGLAKTLGVKVPILKAFDTYPLWRGGQKDWSVWESEPKDRVAANFLARVIRSYRRAGYEIDRAAQQQIGDLLAEVLDNAEEHHGRGWWVSGYVREAAGREYGDCHICIVNLGPSLAETLQELPQGSALREAIEALVEIHRNDRHFFQYADRWTEDDLWTLYALQEGVTRKYEEQKRGYGTVDMINAFEVLGKSVEPGIVPKMCIVSGRTHISFDSESKFVPNRHDPPGRERMILAFNDENDLRKPPREGAITRLKRRFPGTLISLRFYIDPRYLRLRGAQP